MYDRCYIIMPQTKNVNLLCLLFKNKLGTLSQCLYETGAIIAPGVVISSAISSKINHTPFSNSVPMILQSSASYFLSCVVRYNFMYSQAESFDNDYALSISTGAVAGVCYYGAMYHLGETKFSSAYLISSIYLSTGYSIGYSHIPRPYLSATIFSVEVTAASIPSLLTASSIKESALEGSIYGIVYTIIDLVESHLNPPQEQNLPEEQTIPGDTCPAEQEYHLSVLGKNMCEIH